MLIQSTLTEVMCGALGANRLLEAHLAGKHLVPMHLFLDAKAVFDSVTASNVKTPADKILLLHALALRNQLELGQVGTLNWIDTRDMVADGLNKGCIDRTAIRDFFQHGKWIMAHHATWMSWRFGAN